MFNLLCFSPDGERQINSTHETVEEAWENSERAGKNWYFYPFHVITGPSRSNRARIVSVPDAGIIGDFTPFIGKEVRTLARWMAENEADLIAELNG